MAKQKKLEGSDLSQLILSQRLAERVDKWADDALSVDQRWDGTTETTYKLLRYWFFDRDAESPVKFHDCQRRAIETLIYCHEALRRPDGQHIENLRDLYETLAPEAVAEYPHFADALDGNDYRKFCLKLATGTGKTWILQAALVWQYFNAVWEAESRYYSTHFLVVAPGLVVLERLLDAFLGKKDEKGSRDPNKADLRSELFMPPEWRKDFRVRILRPEDLTPSSTPQEGGFVLLLNWHKIVPREERKNLESEIFGPDLGDDMAVAYQEYLAAYPDLVVFNDEAHHVHSKVRKEGAKDLDAKWLEAVKALRNEIQFYHKTNAGLFMQVDFSATPFYGAGEKKELFPHIIYDYDLKHAMHGWSPVLKQNSTLPLVKQLFLEERQGLGGNLDELDFRAVREAEDGTRRGSPVALSKGQMLLLDIGMKKLDQVAEEFERAGVDKKPVLYIVCEENEVADMVYEWLKGRMDSKGRELKDQLLIIHSDKKKEIPEDEWKQVRYLLDTIDEPERVNAKRIVISVLMLREGFDVRNICVAVVLRSSESDILLEQMVGRGLRLMFNGPEFFETKRQALEDISGSQQPSALLDFLFIVEHPRFRQFYDNLRKEGYPVFQGDSRSVVTSGDLTPVPYDEVRLVNYDMAWPVQFHDEGKTPDPSKIPVTSLPAYPMPFSAVKKEFDAITIADVHEPTDKVTSTWRLRTGIFDYGFFLREVANHIVTSKENTILSARRAELMALIDEYASTHLFGEKIDFNQEENYRVLAHTPIFEFVTTHIRKALVELLGKVVYEPQGLWERISKAHQILVRQKNVVATTKCIYPLLSPAPKGGGFEYRFMYECLERSMSVLAYVKLDQHKHNFAVRYRNEFGIARDYYPDFIVKTKDKMYLVETKGDRDMSSPVVARKARAAIGWCEAASGIQPPAEFNQPKEWEYVLLSEKTYNHHGRAGFDALLSACRAELQQLLAFGQGRLF